jgi:hypothetical protein
MLQKRAGARGTHTLYEEMQLVSVDGEQVLALNLAIDELCLVDARKVRPIERAGFTV